LASVFASFLPFSSKVGNSAVFDIIIVSNGFWHGFLKGSSGPAKLLDVSQSSSALQNPVAKVENVPSYDRK
jgi:hypothetical protein